jgi:hypothetical protein
VSKKHRFFARSSNVNVISGCYGHSFSNLHCTTLSVVPKQTRLSRLGFTNGTVASSGAGSALACTTTKNSPVVSASY